MQFSRYSVSMLRLFSLSFSLSHACCCSQDGQRRNRTFTLADMLSREAAEAWWGPRCRQRHTDVSADSTCGSNLALSRHVIFFIKRMLTVGVTRRDATGRAGGRGDRGRDCGKVRQYEQACRWSVPRRYSPWKIILLHSPSDSLFSFPARLLPGSMLRARHAGSRNGAFRELPATAGARTDKSPHDKSNIVAMIMKEGTCVCLGEIDRESIGCDE